MKELKEKAEDAIKWSSLLESKVGKAAKFVKKITSKIKKFIKTIIALVEVIEKCNQSFALGVTLFFLLQVWGFAKITTVAVGAVSVASSFFGPLAGVCAFILNVLLISILIDALNASLKETTDISLEQYDGIVGKP